MENPSSRGIIISQREPGDLQRISRLIATSDQTTARFFKTSAEILDEVRRVVQIAMATASNALQTLMAIAIHDALAWQAVESLAKKLFRESDENFSDFGDSIIESLRRHARQERS